MKMLFQTIQLLGYFTLGYLCNGLAYETTVLIGLAGLLICVGSYGEAMFRAEEIYERLEQRGQQR